MFKTASRKMCGIRLGTGTTLRQQKESQDRFNGIEHSESKRQKITTTPIVVIKNVIKNSKIVIRRIKDSRIEVRKVDGVTVVKVEPPVRNSKQKVMMSDNNCNIIISTSKRNNKKSKNSAMLEIHKKKSGQLFSSQKHLNALLLNAIPGSTCPKCHKRFMGFDRDKMGSLTSKCCNYRAFSQ